MATAVATRHGRRQSRRWTVLSSEERRTWHEIELFWDEEAAEPARPASPTAGRRAPRDPTDLPVAVVTAAWVTLLLFALGAALPGLVVAAVTLVAWVLRRYRPRPVGRAGPGS
jgi:ferric-dicitrate binding protein FerR (iron transport regulator)